MSQKGPERERRRDERKKEEERELVEGSDRQRGCVWKRESERPELPTAALKGKSSLMHTTDKMKPWQQRADTFGVNMFLKCADPKREEISKCSEEVCVDCEHHW